MIGTISVYIVHHHSHLFVATVIIECIKSLFLRNTYVHFSYHPILFNTCHKNVYTVNLTTSENHNLGKPSENL